MPLTPFHTLTQLSLFQAKDSVPTTENGADQAAAARTGLLKKLVGAARAYLDTELDAGGAAGEPGRCEETIRRAVRNGAIPDRRANLHGRHKNRRRDLRSLPLPPAGR